MFTGIVREVGRVVRVEGGDEGLTLEIEAPRTAADLAVGDSVSVAGVCLTAETVGDGAMRFHAVPETLARTTLARLAPGDPVRLRLRRDGKLVDVTVKTVAAPEDDGRAIIGIRVSQDANIELPREVDIDLGDVGGASAGLPFALEVYQQLGKDVDRGLRVAATGEIQLDGSVSPVGGIKQKTVGVRRSGVDVFLVPAGENASTARRYAGTLRIVPVESFRQALRVLQTLPQK